jgi:FkbM family methyltransferase
MIIRGYPSLIVVTTFLLRYVGSVGLSIHFPMWAMNETSSYSKQHRDIHIPFSGWKNLTLSQNHEDIDAYETYFYGLHHGIVLETGGGEFTTTNFFEKVAQWRAIHIEADPKVFRKLKSARSNQINVHAALCSENRIVHFVSSEFNAAGVYEHWSESFIDKWHKDLRDDPQKVASLPKIPCVTITSLLLRLGITHVDLWVLDTDGTEEDILKGLDTSKVSIASQQ